jgi:hypothetical protein
LWLVVEHAIKDHGIAELRALERGDDVVLPSVLAAVRRKIREEAESAAIRIAALVSEQSVSDAAMLNYRYRFLL